MVHLPPAVVVTPPRTSVARGVRSPAPPVTTSKAVAARPKALSRPPPPPLRGPATSFVTVAPDGSSFWLNGGPWVVSGANQYALMTTGTYDWATVEKALDEAVGLRLNLLRTWAFAERPANASGGVVLQSAPGVFEEPTFVALDRVVAAADARGLRLLLALANNWDAYGGAPAYLSWAAAAGEELAAAVPPDVTPFFASPFCKAAYKRFVATLLMRTNTVSGRVYKDDPAILGFDLMNEARTQSELSGDLLASWYSEMAQFVKGLDGNHLVTTGAEGGRGGGAADTARRHGRVLRRLHPRARGPQPRQQPEQHGQRLRAPPPPAGR